MVSILNTADGVLIGVDGIQNRIGAYQNRIDAYQNRIVRFFWASMGFKIESTGSKTELTPIKTIFLELISAIYGLAILTTSKFSVATRSLIDRILGINEATHQSGAFILFERNST
jgi:hypothetical protein